MKDQLKRILDLVRKTGDTLVVTDTNGQDTYVVMNLDRYEAMLEDQSEVPSKTQEKIESNPIQHEKAVAEWQIPEEFIIDDPEGGLADELQPSEPLLETTRPSSSPDIWTAMQSANDSGPTWDISQMSTDEMADLERQYKEFASKTVEKAIEDTKNPIQPPLANTQPPAPSRPDDDFSEEQFYLEPVE